MDVFIYVTIFRLMFFLFLGKIPRIGIVPSHIGGLVIVIVVLNEMEVSLWEIKGGGRVKKYPTENIGFSNG